VKIQKLEDLKAWEESRKLAFLIFKLLNKLPDKEKYILKKHLWECARNIPGNIAEGFGRYHFQESMQFYRIARGSLMEIKSDAYLCFDCKYWTKRDFEDVIKQILQVKKLLNGLISSTKKQKKNY
jgi:four helix bundle protein